MRKDKGTGKTQKYNTRVFQYLKWRERHARDIKRYTKILLQKGEGDLMRIPGWRGHSFIDKKKDIIARKIMLLIDKVIDKLLRIETCQPTFDDTTNSLTETCSLINGGKYNATESCYYFNIISGLVECLRQGSKTKEATFVDVGCGAARPIILLCFLSLALT